MLHWYVLKSHPNKELSTYALLGALEIESFYPALYVKPANPRARRLVPYFPGYLFVRTDLKQTRTMLERLPGTSGVVSFGGEPAVVPDSLIKAVYKRVEQANLETSEDDDLQPGTLLVVDEGAFEGYQAIFDHRLEGTDRVRVLLLFLQDRQVPLEIDLSKTRVSPKAPRRRHK
jgi:transcription antitermination factor NusG